MLHWQYFLSYLSNLLQDASLAKLSPDLAVTVILPQSSDQIFHARWRREEGIRIRDIIGEIFMGRG